MVVELLLELEGLGHVGLGFGQRFGEVAYRGVAVLGLGEPELLLAGLDGVVGFNDEGAALAAEFLDAE